MIAWYWLLVVFFGSWWIGYLSRRIDSQESKQLERNILAYGSRLGEFTGFQISHEIEGETGKIIGFGNLYRALENLVDIGGLSYREDESVTPKRRYYSLVKEEKK